MKLHCPHCGVKGSTEDSYLGRKVKCPKCQGIFEVLPDLAAEPPAEASFSAASSPLPVDVQSSEPEVDISVPVDEDLAETEVENEADTLLAEEVSEVPSERSEDGTVPEPVATSATEQEETLDWEDIASEVDVQLAEATMEEEQDKPAALSSSSKQHEESVGDFDLTEKLSPHDDAENPAEVRDKDQEEISVAESSEKNMLDDGVELEPYGIDKEQCWQCGKEKGVGESFTAKDGRLYCVDCAPVENQKETAVSGHEQIPAEMLNSDSPIDGEKEVSDDSTGGNEDEKPAGKTIYQAWGKVRDTFAKWFGK